VESLLLQRRKLVVRLEGLSSSNTNCYVRKVMCECKTYGATGAKHTRVVKGGRLNNLEGRAKEHSSPTMMVARVALSFLTIACWTDPSLARD